MMYNLHRKTSNIGDFKDLEQVMRLKMGKPSFTDVLTEFEKGAYSSEKDLCITRRKD